MPEYYADRLFNALERAEPAAGMMLVSAPGMMDPTFARSIVLIIEHSVQHTIGVILNKRSEIAVANVLPDWANAVVNPAALYIGGPVNQQAVVGVGMTQMGVKIDEHSQLQRLANRLVHVNLRSDPLEMSVLMTGLRLFAGYSEWQPGQLDEEIERGDWYVVPALPGDVIMPGFVDLYAEVMRRQPMPLPLFATYPLDPSEN